MSRVSRRAARRELEAADAFGVKRVRRARYESAPDIEPVVLSTGDVLVEVKSRATLPVLLRDALDQAKGYRPEGVPVAVLSALGGSAVACLPLADFVRLLGCYGLLGRMGGPTPKEVRASLAPDPFLDRSA